MDYIDFPISTLTSFHIERVTEYKYLGIWLNGKLTFKYEINMLVYKLRPKLDFLYRNKQLMCRKTIDEAVHLSVVDNGHVIY